MKAYRWWLNKSYSLLIIVSAFCVGASVSTPFPALAMEPPRPGEIDKLKAEGKYMSRLETVKKIGNHRADPYRLKRAAIKLQRKILESRGMTKSELDQSLPLPPPIWQGMPSTGTVRTFALLIEFQDHMHTVNQADINDMLYGAGDSSDYPRESLTSYYDRSSYGLLDLSQGMTLGWYQTSYDRSAVVNTTAGRQNLIKEALNHYDSAGHDFSVYDNDGDGDIDYFIVMWTGPDAGWGSFWWGYMTYWQDGSYTLDGKKLRKYSWQWESDSPVVVIHETGHALGLPDLYDYDVDVGPDGGVGGFDMMDATRGDHNCFSKWLLDWITPMVVAGGRQGLELDAATSSTDAVIIWPGIGPGDIFSEFFMVQNRQDAGNDSSFWFKPDGYAIWHIDARLNVWGSNFLYDNSFTDHKFVKLMQADGREDIETARCLPESTCSSNPGWTCSVDEHCQWATSDDIYTSGDALGPNTTPSSAKYDGSDSCVKVWGINDAGPAADASISAYFRTVCHDGAATGALHNLLLFMDDN